MPSVVLDECPHCGSEKIACAIVGESHSPIPQPTGTGLFFDLMVCGACAKPIVAVIKWTIGTSLGTSPIQCAIDPLKLGYALVAVYPQSAPPKIPAHVPDNLKGIFNQAADNLKRGHWDASGAMSRKVVDVSTQQLLGADSAKFGNIKGRIDEVAKRGRITPDLQDWAHEIRLGGNDAAHDQDPYTEPEAKEQLDFTELYLTYVYTLPKMLADRKAKKP